MTELMKELEIKAQILEEADKAEMFSHYIVREATRQGLSKGALCMAVIGTARVLARQEKSAWDLAESLWGLVPKHKDKADA